MKKKTRLILISTLGAVGLFLIIEIVAIVVFWPSEGTWRTAAFRADEEAKPADKISSEIASNKKKLVMMQPRGLYVQVDSAENRLCLKKDGKIVRESVVSCGSGSILEDPRGKRRWIFDTPRGEFYVKYKIKDPDWVKPDWAFIEEGKEPPKNQADRVESGTLGDYALGFGEGYFIHGTLYTRLLGRNVTHGCVRVGDKDLEVIYQSVPVGTKIYIY